MHLLFNIFLYNRNLWGFLKFSLDDFVFFLSCCCCCYCFSVSNAKKYLKYRIICCILKVFLKCFGQFKEKHLRQTLFFNKGKSLFLRTPFEMCGESGLVGKGVVMRIRRFVVQTPSGAWPGWGTQPRYEAPGDLRVGYVKKTHW